MFFTACTTSGLSFLSSSRLYFLLVLPTLFFLFSYGLPIPFCVEVLCDCYYLLVFIIIADSQDSAQALLLRSRRASSRRWMFGAQKAFFKACTYFTSFHYSSLGHWQWFWLKSWRTPSTKISIYSALIEFLEEVF